MANTLKKIQTITVGSGGASSIEFTSIPQTYTDLKIVICARSSRNTGTSTNLSLKFNASSTSYSNRQLFGNGSTASSQTNTYTDSGLIGVQTQDTDTASVFSSSEVYIPNYTSSNYKSWSADSVRENNATSGGLTLNAGLWSNTAAITSISLIMENGTFNFMQYSTATLYGISNANTTVGGSGKATGGNQVYTDGTYWYHVFTSDGTFTATSDLSVDYLVIAGGGGGGGGNGACGGGGAGGYKTGTLSITSGAKTVTVGAGGAGQTGSDKGADGNDSIFDSITSTKGGGGGGPEQTGNTGGSGGGGGNRANGASGTAGQGNNGGNGVGSSSFAGGGGGGASANGGTPSTSLGATAGAGGSGTASSITGTSVTRAGGGAGGGDYFSSRSVAGTGGSGGGGNGGVNDGVAGSGTVNTGSGGGGAGRLSTGGDGGSGGSGIVIVKYAA